MSNGYHYSITWRWHLKILNWSNTSCSCSFSSLISSISSASKSSALPLSALSLSLPSAPKSSALPLSAVARNAEGEVLRWGFRPVHGLVSPLATELQAIKEGFGWGIFEAAKLLGWVGLCRGDCNGDLWKQRPISWRWRIWFGDLAISFFVLAFFFLNDWFWFFFLV